VALSIHDALCENGNYAGSVVAQGQVNGPWSYTWQDASGNVVHSTNNSNGADSLTSMASGTYTLIIHNATGNCAVTSETFTINGTAPIASNALVTSTSCNGTADGAINLTPTGGQGALTLLWADNSTADVKSDLPAGSYPVTITDAAGCAHIETISVNQPDAINAAFTPAASHVYLSNGGWAAFTNQSTGANEFTWDFGDGSPSFTGTTAAHQYTAAGLYTVTLTARNGSCDGSSQQLIMVEQNPTGIRETDVKNGVSILSQEGSVDLYFNLTHETTMDISIYSTLGQQVYAIKDITLSNQRLAIPVRQLIPGIYFVSLSYSGHFESHQLFIH